MDKQTKARIDAISIEGFYPEIEMADISASQLLGEIKNNPNIDVKVRPDLISIEGPGQDVFIYRDRLIVGCQKVEDDYESLRSHLINLFKKIVTELKLQVQMVSVNVGSAVEMEAKTANILLSSPLSKLVPEKLTKQVLFSGFNWVSALEEKIVQIQAMTGEKQPGELLIYSGVTFQQPNFDIKSIDEIIVRESDYITNDLTRNTIKTIGEASIEG